MTMPPSIAAPAIPRKLESPDASNNQRVGARFGRAAADYDGHAQVQRTAARQLADRIARLPLPRRPRVLEIGCGTGLFTRELAKRIGPADWTITDIAAPMLAAAQRALVLPGNSRFVLMDGEHPTLPEIGYDLICSNFAVQWFDDLNAGLARLADALAPGGYLAISTLAEHTFHEWRNAHRALGLCPSMRIYPAADAISPRPHHRSAIDGHVDAVTVTLAQRDGLAFVRGLKKIGASIPAHGTAPLSSPNLKRVIEHFNQQGANVSYHIAYGTWRKAPSPHHGVFVTGTDTGIGKTLVSAVLTRAWGADYWKPLQTGMADEAGDTPTVRALAGLDDSRIHAPAYALQAPLSPWAAAECEALTIDRETLKLPATTNTLVVEGAGGLYVPVDEQTMIIDLIGRFGLPVVLVARSGLGTINHTLLSLEALRHRAIPVLGVVLVGALSPGNKRAIEQFGKTRVIAEIDVLPEVNADAVAEVATGIAPLATLR